MPSILHIITRLDVGGSAENTLLTAIGQARNGHKVTIICGHSENPSSDNEHKATKAGVSIVRMPGLVRNISPVSDLSALIRLIVHLTANRYDIVHTHTSKAGVVGRIAAHLTRVPRVVHTPHGHIFYGYFSNLLTRVFVWIEKALMAWTDIQITLTQKEKDDYLAHGIGPAEKMVPVYSGIELEPLLNFVPDRAEMRQSLGIGKNDFIAGTIARLVPVKNHSLLIKAADRLKALAPQLKFVFVGDGELRENLEREIRERDLASRFIFTGWRGDIAAVLGAFDVFVMCSRNEGMGRAFVEAQACGVPVIGSRVGGIAEVLSDGTTGYLVDPRNPQDVADKLLHLYNDRGILGRMSGACKDWVRTRFGAEIMISKIEEIYKKMME